MNRTSQGELPGVKTVMKNEELRNAIEDVYKERRNLPQPTGPLPEHEVIRRELLLLKQAILYRIEEARKQNKKKREMFNIELYGLINSFLESY